MTTTEKIGAALVGVIVLTVLTLVVTGAFPGGVECDVDGVRVDEAGHPIPSGDVGYTTTCPVTTEGG